MVVPDLQLVADVYNDAARTCHAPTLAVQKHFGTSRSTAGRWVRAARNAGLLDRVGWGSSPRLNWKVVAVARELGVDPAALQAAILLHAGGDLRIPVTPGRSKTAPPRPGHARGTGQGGTRGRTRRAARTSADGMTFRSDAHPKDDSTGE